MRDKLSKKTKITEKIWFKTKNLSFKERYQKLKDSQDKLFLKDKITGEIHSMKRQRKKEVLKTLESPSGRQLKKLRRYLKQNGTSSEIR